ncbi:unnamed protein product [Lactuca virosa]|uniref:Uncharacterized protein n=1 Tax=Lactuca virosa TaxID=75947 RepID=A0AAU9PED2_9ASTR|nr:unnamed protein product [Lactuca virosa]
MIVLGHQVQVPACRVDGCWQVASCDCVVGALWGVVVVVVAGCAVAAGVGHHKLAMNSATEPSGGVVCVCGSDCPSSVDGPLPSRDCIGRTGLVASPSCCGSPLSVISGAWSCFVGFAGSSANPDGANCCDMSPD